MGVGRAIARLLPDPVSHFQIDWLLVGDAGAEHPVDVGRCILRRGLERLAVSSQSLAIWASGRWLGLALHS